MLQETEMLEAGLYRRWKALVGTKKYPRMCGGGRSQRVLTAPLFGASSRVTVKDASESG